MPKNTGGGKHKYLKKSGFGSRTRKVGDLRKSIDDNTVYGRILESVGNKRFTVRCQDINPDRPYRTLNCQLAGSIRKRVTPGMYVLVQNWGDLTTKLKGTISDFYTDSEVDVLRSHNLWDYEDAADKSNIVGIEFESDANSKKQTNIKSAVEAAKKKTGERENVEHFEDDFDIEGI